jgi:hypothetical protein
MTYVDVGGLRTWHEMTGEGEPLVLLHGAFGGAAFVVEPDRGTGSGGLPGS